MPGMTPLIVGGVVSTGGAVVAVMLGASGAAAFTAGPVVMMFTPANVEEHRANDAALATSHFFTVKLCGDARFIT
jgi:hypothetical protein